MIVSVRWIDVSKKTCDDDFDDKMDIDSRLTKMESIGWLHKETPTTILLVQEYDRDSGRPRDWVAIPKTLIEGDVTKIGE